MFPHLGKTLRIQAKLFDVAGAPLFPIATNPPPIFTTSYSSLIVTETREKL